MARQMLIETRLRARASRADEAVQRHNTRQAKFGEAEASESALGAARHGQGHSTGAPPKGAAPCKFWASDTGCMRGGACAFSHSLKKEKACLRCGAKYHWAKDCTRPKKEAAPGKGGKGSGKFVTLEGEDVTLAKDDSKGKGKTNSKTKTKSKTKQGKSKSAEGQESAGDEWSEEIPQEQQ